MRALIASFVQKHLMSTGTWGPDRGLVFHSKQCTNGLTQSVQRLASTIKSVQLTGSPFGSNSLHQHRTFSLGRASNRVDWELAGPNRALPIVASACKRKFHASARCFAAEEAAASAEAYASATSKACEDVDSTTAGENGRWSQPNAAGAAAAVGSLGAASAAGAATNGGSADGSDNRSTDSTEQSSSTSSSESASTTQATATTTTHSAGRPGLILHSGAAMLPHPEKMARGGEDAYFIASHQAAVGVADGVGGWAEVGIDAGAYARLLMSNCQDEAEAAMQSSNVSSLSAQDILQRAFDKTDVEGSSTACVIVINGNTISASNLGDSGFVLLRNKVVVFQSPQQQHNFNFPFQLGSREGLSDQPQAAMRFELQAQLGDIIVVGSDGLWDNVFTEEVATIVSKCKDKGESPEMAAQVLCRYARMRASDAKYHSPFSYSAVQAGFVHLGGKMDDITVLVSYVTLPSKL
eukprot:jgi/Chrzof1/4914/Cz15g04100.t1